MAFFELNCAPDRGEKPALIYTIKKGREMISPHERVYTVGMERGELGVKNGKGREFHEKEKAGQKKRPASGKGEAKEKILYQDHESSRPQTETGFKCWTRERSTRRRSKKGTQRS